MMKNSSRLVFLLLTAALTLSACNGGGGNNQVATDNKPELDTTAPAPAASTPAASAPAPSAPTASSEAPDTSAPAPSPAAGSQTYQEPSGLFQISLPAGYTQEDTGSGISFESADKGFSGSVDFGSAQGNQLTTQQLEEALKQEYENRLDQVTWQDSQIQPDGSVRLDWVGRDKAGNDLDAISFVEQRGDNVFILNLFAVNKPYNDYNEDAQAIVSSYRVRQN
jgi:hypothetical protein